MADIIIIGWARVRKANYQTRKMLEHWSGGASMKKKERGKKWDKKKKSGKKEEKFQCGSRARDLLVCGHRKVLL